jgi:hypothetical protein
MSSSRTLSNVAESEPPSRTIGMTLLRSRPEQRGGELRLARPHPVLVAHERVDLAVVGDHAVGWLSSQLGNVFVENRECTSAMPDANAGSCRSGKYRRSWWEMSIPL